MQIVVQQLQMFEINLSNIEKYNVYLDATANIAYHLSVVYYTCGSNCAIEIKYNDSGDKTGNNGRIMQMCHRSKSHSPGGGLPMTRLQLLSPAGVRRS